MIKWMRSIHLSGSDMDRDYDNYPQKSKIYPHCISDIKMVDTEDGATIFNQGYNPQTKFINHPYGDSIMEVKYVHQL